MFAETEAERRGRVEREKAFELSGSLLSLLVRRDYEVSVRLFYDRTHAVAIAVRYCGKRRYYATGSDVGKAISALYEMVRDAEETEELLSRHTSKEAA